MNPAAIAIAVADAVRAELAAGVAAGAFSQTFAPARTYDTELELEDSAGLRVDVLYGDIGLDRDTREAWLVTIPIDIAVRSHCRESDTEAADELATLAGQVWEYFAGNNGTPRPLGDYPEASLVMPEKDVFAPYLPNVLHRRNQFTAIVRLDYEVSAP